MHAPLSCLWQRLAVPSHMPCKGAPRVAAACLSPLYLQDLRGVVVPVPVQCIDASLRVPLAVEAHKRNATEQPDIVLWVLVTSWAPRVLRAMRPKRRHQHPPYKKES